MTNSTETLKNLASSLAVWHIRSAEEHYAAVARGDREPTRYSHLTERVTADYWGGLINTAGHPTGKALGALRCTTAQLKSVTSEAQSIGQAMVRAFPEQYRHFVAARIAEKARS